MSARRPRPTAILAGVVAAASAMVAGVTTAGADGPVTVRGTDRPVAGQRLEAGAATRVAVGPRETISLHPRDVAAPERDYDLQIRAAVGWGGTATAVWYREPEVGSRQRGGVLYASTRRRSGTWSTPYAVSRRFDLVDGHFRVAAGRRGDVAVVWSARRAGGGQKVLVALRSATGGWREPQTLGRGTEPRITMDGRGRAHVMWHRRTLRIATGMVEQPWTVHRLPDSAAPWGWDVATNRAGDAIAIWSDFSACGCVRVTTRSRSAGEWSRPRDLRGAYFNEDGPALGVFPDGGVLAGFRDGEDLSWALRPPRGRWSPIRAIPEPHGYIEQGGGLSIAVAANRHALATWYASDGGSFVARYRPGRGFGTPTRLSRHSSYLGTSKLIRADGTGLVAGNLHHGNGPPVFMKQPGPGKRWNRPRRVDVDDSRALNGAARGSRMVLLIFDQGLHARVLAVEPRTVAPSVERSSSGARG